MAEASSVVIVDAATESVEVVPDGHGQVIVANDSDAILYLRYGSEAATPTAWSVKLGSQDTLIETEYRGPIQGVWQAADGQARVTVVP